MKYLFFAAAVIGILPGTVFMLCERRLIRWGAIMLVLPLCAFDFTSISFFSHVSYRGTSCGMEISLVFIVAATLLLTFTILRGKRTLLPDWGSRLYLLYFLLTLPSFFNTPSMVYSFFELWKMIMIYLVFLAVYYYLEFSDGDVDIILYGVAIMVAVNFFIVLSQYMVGVYQAQGVFPHQNSMAMYMMLAGLIFFSRCLNHSGEGSTKIFFFAFLMASTALARTFSRGALFCYPFGGMLTVLWSFYGGISMRKFKFLMMLIPLMLVGVIIAAPKIIERFEKAPKNSAETRKSLAISALNMMKDKYWCGVGLNNWGIVINPPYKYSEHREEERGDSDDYHDAIVETIYLLVGAECGVPCLLALLLLFGYYWISTIRLMVRLRRTSYFYLPAGLFGALTGVYMQSALEWVLKQQINFIWLMTVFAIISFLNRHYRDLIALEEKKEAGSEAGSEANA